MGVTLTSIFDAPLLRPAVAEGVFLNNNWHFSSEDLWSCAKECSVLLMSDSFPEQINLAIEIRVFNASPVRPKRVLVQSPGSPALALEITTTDPQVIIVPSPVFPKGAASADITFQLDELDSPFLLGYSQDDRCLGIKILSVHRLTSDMSFPLDFSKTSVYQAILKENWAPPEPTGVWSTGKAATMVLPSFLRTADPVLSFDFWHLPRPTGAAPLVVTVECNDEIVAEWICGQESSGPWLCPVNTVWHPNQALRIALHFKNIATPSELGINSDQRQLGVFLKLLGLGAEDALRESFRDAGS